MTNVRVLHSICRLLQPSNTVCSERAKGSNHGVALRARFCAAAAVLLSMLLAHCQTAHGQVPSGAAGGEIVDINRQGLGISARGGHVAGDTVGRADSASLFELSPYVNIGNGLIFGDARLVYGNEGGMDYSFGAGYRHYVPAWDAVAGANIYSDRGNISGTFFKSWGVGAELLANGWEIRANGYSPYGTKSVQTGVRADSNSAVFTGNNVRFSRIDTFREALHGFDAEVGWLLPGNFAERFDVRAFGGGYWYRGEGIPEFSGFTARLQTDIRDIVELGLKLSDDEVFHTNVTFTAMLHYGGFNSQEHTRRSGIQRMAEPVRRNLNVPVVNADVIVPNQIAQAADGTNLTIIHVNSNSPPGGTGTVDNPFDMLSTGLGFTHPEVVDVVFVHAGSQFTDPANNSVTLNANQSVFGEGLIQVQDPDLAGPAGFIRNRQVLNVVNLTGIGPLTLPDSPTFRRDRAAFLGQPFATPLTAAVTRPTLTGAIGDSLTLDTNSRAAGLILNSPAGNGLVISGVGGTNVRDMEITNPGASGILVSGTPTSSTTTIVNTIVNNMTGTAPAFDITGGGGSVIFQSNGLSTDPPLARIENTAPGAFALRIQNRIGGPSFNPLLPTSGGSVNMFSSTVRDNGGAGVLITNNANTSAESTFLDVVVDNLLLRSSTGNGLAITRTAALPDPGSERYVIANSATLNNPPANTPASSTFIDSATDVSVLISDLPEDSSVRFLNEVEITNAGATGIHMNRIGGEVLFAQDVTIGPPAVAGAPAGVLVENSTATGRVQFTQDLTLGGTAPLAPTFLDGIRLTANATGSTFTVFGDTTVGSTATNGISVTADDGTVLFSGTVDITNRLGVGINIDDTTGPITFGQAGTATTIGNNTTTPSFMSALIVNRSESAVHFDDLNVQLPVTTLPTPNQYAVSLTENFAGVTTRTALVRGTDTVPITFDNLSIAGGAVLSPGLFGNQNDLIVVRNIAGQRGASSILTSEGAPAVNITESGMDITLEAVNSTDSPDYGIRLVETNKEPLPDRPAQIRKRFQVLGAPPAAGSGGGILNAGTVGGGLPATAANAGAGVFAQNGGQIRLDHMNLDANNIGVLVRNSNIGLMEDQFVELRNAVVTDHLRHGVRATNLHRLVITDNSLFLFNGVAPRVVGEERREAVLLDYNENPLTAATPAMQTTLFDDYDNPYQVFIQDNDAQTVAAFNHETDTAVEILNTGAGADAHIDVLIEDTGFRIGDTFDLFAGESENAFDMAWNGVARVNILDNVVVLDGVNRMIAPDPNPGSQDAFQLDFTSRSDETLLEIARNDISATIQDNSTGIRLNTAGPIDGLIDNNTMTFNGLDSAGARFRLNQNDNTRFVRLTNNTIDFPAAGADGGVGFLFERVQAPTNLEFSGNFISLFDANNVANPDTLFNNGEAGIRFQTVIGVVTLRSRTNNQIGLNPASGGDIDAIFNLLPGQARGTVLINGVQLP